MEINEIAERVNKWATSRGKHDGKTQMGVYLMNICTEMGEAMNAHRDENHVDLNGYYHTINSIGEKRAFQTYIKDKFETELVDGLLRLIDTCKINKVNLPEMIEIIMSYNEKYR